MVFKDRGRSKAHCLSGIFQSRFRKTLAAFTTALKLGLDGLKSDVN